MPPLDRRSITARAAVIALAVVACATPGPAGSPGMATSQPAASSPTVATASPAVPSGRPSAPATSPSVAPEPTVEGALPLRTQVEINADVVARPGVPADLAGLYWSTYADAGLVGTTAQIGLPAGEHILDVHDGLVVAERVPHDAGSGAVVVVRDFSTGSIVREVDAGVTSITARIIGRHLVWAGIGRGEACNDGDPSIDGGVWAIDLDASAGPMEIVAPGTPVVPCFSGRLLLLNPAGTTLAAVMTSYGESNWVDVIDVATMSHTRRLDQLWPWAISGGTALQWDQQPTDFMAVGWGMSAYNLGTGAVRWRFPDEKDVDQFAPYPIVAVGSTFAVQYHWGTGDPAERVVAIFDPRTGERRELLRESVGSSSGGLWVAPELSSGGTLGLVAPDRALVDAPISVIDVESGTLTRDAFVIDPPWICFPEYCLRD